MLTQRIISSIVLIPIVLAATYLGGAWFAALVTVAALLAGYEFYRIMRNGGFHPSYVMGLALISLLLWDAYTPARGIGRLAAAAAIAISMVWQILQDDTRGFLLQWSLMLAGAFYVGGLAGHMISLRNLPDGLSWMWLCFAATWTCDTAAYFAGNWWGKHPFFAHISPHKTWEGAIGGGLLGILAAALFATWMGYPAGHGLALGVLAAAAATFGDLAESLVKRQVGVKDSGALIPGHGGMLDRIDSLLFVCTAVYYYVILVIR